MNSQQPLKIVIAYENLGAAIRAKELSENVAAQLGSEYDAWPFEWLCVDWVRDYSVAQAAEADMIIIAAGGAAELPREVRDWMETWLAGRRREHSGALVALLEEELPPADMDGLRAYFRDIAERGDLELFCSAGTLAASGDRENASAPDRSLLQLRWKRRTLDERVESFALRNQ